MSTPTPPSKSLTRRSPAPMPSAPLPSAPRPMPLGSSGYKFTPGVQLRLIEAASKGATNTMAADCAGVSRKTLWEWLRKGEREIEEYEAALELGKNAVLGCFGVFVQAFNEAGSQMAVEMLERIREAAKDPRNWAAAMTFLERRYPSEWGRRNPDRVLEAESVRPPSGPQQIVIRYANDWRNLEAEDDEALKAYEAGTY